MKSDTWRGAAQAVLQDVFAELPAAATIQQARKAIKDAYPFGQRAMWPYKVWCDEARLWMEKRFPELAEARQQKQKEALAREIESRGGAVVQMPVAQSLTLPGLEL